MSDLDKSLLSLVNTSGFPFQIRVEDEIRKTQKDHSWQVLAREHPWRDPESHEDGFIDLVLGRGMYRIIIECKRARDGHWVFLLPESEKNKRHQARLFWSMSSPTDPQQCAWSDDFSFKSPFYQSSFCIPRGQDDKARPMLERLAASVVRATESISVQEFDLLRSRGMRTPKVYIPAIITTASLIVCHFEAGEVNIQDGQFPQAPMSEGQFETVPYLIFRKALDTTMPFRARPGDLTEVNAELERSVFIVNSTHLSGFLSVINPLDPRSNLWPWAQMGL